MGAPPHIGCVGAVLASQLIAAHLFGAQASDTAVAIPAVTLALGLTAVAATLPAALRAAGIDPLVAIRTD